MIHYLMKYNAMVDAAAFLMLKAGYFYYPDRLVKKRSPEIRDAVATINNRIGATVDFSEPLTKTLLSERDGCNLLLVFIIDVFKPSIQDFDSLLFAIHTINDSQKIRRFLIAMSEDCSLEHKRTVEELSGLIVSSDVLSPETKNNLLYAFINFDILIDRAYKLIRTITDIINETLAEKSIVPSLESYDTIINEDLPGFMEKYCKIKLDSEEVYLLPSLLDHPFGTAEHSSPRTSILVPFDIFSQENNVRRELGNTDILFDYLMCISDSTKYQILNLLNNEKLYGAQIAEKLGLTTATISYHMTALRHLIVCEKVNNRVYYGINRTVFGEISDRLNVVFGENKGSEINE